MFPEAASCRKSGFYENRSGSFCDNFAKTDAVTSGDPFKAQPHPKAVVATPAPPGTAQPLAIRVSVAFVLIPYVAANIPIRRQTEPSDLEPLMKVD